MGFPFSIFGKYLLWKSVFALNLFFFGLMKILIILQIQNVLEYFGKHAFEDSQYNQWVNISKDRNATRNERSFT